MTTTATREGWSMTALLDIGHWYTVHDGDDRARALYLRHYSGRLHHPNSASPLFVGPVRDRMVLLTPTHDALFVWAVTEYRKDGQQGVNCAVFRNESLTLSSDLIREATQHAWARWPGQRLWTYVHPRKIRSTNPGYCFLMAGWRRCGTSKGGLVILEMEAAA